MNVELVERVRLAQQHLGIPWDYVAEALHLGLTADALAEAADHWEGRVAEVEGEALAEVNLHPGNKGGRRVRRKQVEDESYLPGDNNLEQGLPEGR